MRSEPISDELREQENKLIISYHTLRRLIGCLGIALPLLCLMYALIVGVCGIESSISTYYHTGMRTVFVGILCVLGTFMITYNGYDLKESVISSVGGIFSVLVAFFPTKYISPCETQYPLDRSVFTVPRIPEEVNTVHHVAAACLFLIFAFMSIAIFTRDYRRSTNRYWLFRDQNKEKNLGDRKVIRNRVYRTCGWIVFACILIMAANAQFDIIVDGDVTFWGETIALLAFGFSWLVKGQAIFSDLTQSSPDYVLTQDICYVMLNP